MGSYSCFLNLITILNFAIGSTPELMETLVKELEIQSFHVQTVVVSRYASTLISCKISNPSPMLREAQFSVMLPGNAFISNLTIEAGGQNYTSVVQEREEARQTYEMAKIKGTNAAIIHQKERETSRFRVDVSISPNDEVTFYLNYEELLQRVLGNYTLRLNVHPNYPVRDLLVDVTIHETRPISLLQVVKVPGGEDFSGAVSEWKEGKKTVRLQFDPDPNSLPEEIPIHGQLVIQYDVERSLDAGDVQIEEDYFVHFFAPIELQHTPKDITFLIDTSGSMSGAKIEQVKNALKRILLDLNTGDSYRIITFSDEAKLLTSARYSPATVRRSLKAILTLMADGSTNLEGGLKVAFSFDRHLTSSSTCPSSSHRSSRNDAIWPSSALFREDPTNAEIKSRIIVILTDGRPTAGVTETNQILKATRDRNQNSASIYCLAFGDDADYLLMEKLALQNGGTFHKIYEDYDAADQLKHFYESLATPLLLDVRFKYSDNSVIPETVTDNNFHNYFLGTELIVAGQVNPSANGGIKANITGQGRNGEFTLSVTDWNSVLPPDEQLLSEMGLPSIPKNFIRRLWSFLMIKDLINEEKAAIKDEDRANARMKALRLALQYNFVTPLTSLVVVQPNSQECKDYGDDYEHYYDMLDEIDNPTTDPDLTDQGEVESIEDADDDSLNAGSMKTFDLSPRIYGQYNRDNHPDEKLLAEMNTRTIMPLSSSSSLCPCSTCFLIISLTLYYFTFSYHITQYLVET